MFRLYFKHLYPSYLEWQESPFAPWRFDDEGVLFSIVSFLESKLLEEDFCVSESLQCETFMDSGAFAAESMGFSLDPFEVAEMHALLKADLIVPLDRIILAEDPDAVIEQKIAETISNTEILLDFRPKGSEIVGPLQGNSPEIIKEMFEKYRELGIRKFALGGLVFKSDLNMTIDLIKTARIITQGFTFHVFGKFLHPRLLKAVIEIGADSVDGFGYILSSVRGLYIVIQEQRYEVIANITEDQLTMCSCPACQENLLQDFQRGDEDAQYLLIIHNIHALIKLKEQYILELKKEEKGE